jgi:hypothetical protein
MLCISRLFIKKIIMSRCRLLLLLLLFKNSVFPFNFSSWELSLGIIVDGGHGAHFR